MAVKTLLRSFAGGEVTPELFGRVDLGKFQTGLQRVRNMIVLPHGPVARRPGTYFVNEAKDSTQAVRLVPFVFSADQAVMLELGAGYIRFHTGNGTVLEPTKVVTAVTQASPGVFTSAGHGFANGDWLFTALLAGMPSLNGRFYRVANVTTDTFTLETLGGVPVSTAAIGPYTGGGTVARAYTVATPYAAADLFKIRTAQSADVLTLAHPLYAARELRRIGATNWQFTAITFAPTGTIPSGLEARLTKSTAGPDTRYKYVVTSVAADGVTESLPSAPVGVSNALNLAGNYNTVFADPTAGSTRTNFYKLSAGVYGFLGQDSPVAARTLVSITRVGTTATATTAAPHGLSDGDVVKHTGATPAQYNGTFRLTGVPTPTTYTYVMGSDPGASAAPVGVYVVLPSIVDDNVLPDRSRTPPEDIYTLNTAPGDYPTAVSYYEQRRWLGGTLNEPQTVWATRNGTESNLTSSIPSRDDDALKFRIASQQQNAVRHLLPLSDLLGLTAAGEWRIFADSAPAITPNSLSVKPQGYAGAADAQPVLTSSSILYVQAQGSRVRELAYGGEASNYSYRSIDISIMAPHLFNGFDIPELTYCRTPDQIMWATRSDGKLLGLSYVPEQQVYGWHQHDTAGLFESCAVIPENNQDTLYVVVRRTVEGRTVRYIERLTPRIFVDAEDAFFVDSGLSYSGAPTTTLSGLWHLEGLTVSALADGAVVPTQVVTNGTITLDTAASTVHVGLRYTSDVQTLPLAFDGAPAAGQGTQKNVNAVHFRVAQSSLVKAGPTFDKLREYPARAVTDPYGSPPALRNGEISMRIDPSWTTDGSICIRQEEPLPLTVLSLAIEVAIGG